MSTCLTTKLDGVVTDKDFRAPSEFRIKVTKQDNYIQVRSWFTINSRVNQTIKIINEADGEDNYFFDINGNNFGKSVDCQALVNRQVYCSNGNYEISIPNKYAIATFDMGRYSPRMDFFTFDIDELKYIVGLQTWNTSGVTAKGDLKSLAQNTTLQNLTLERTNVKGDIGDLKTLTKMQYIRLAADNDVTGDISVIEHMPDLRNLEIGGCIGITGNLSSFTNCPRLSWVNLPNVTGMINITGDISAFANKNEMVSLYCQNEPEVEGDISVFSTNTSKLVNLYISGCNLSGDIDSLATCNRIANCTVTNNKNVAGDLGVFLANKPYLTYISCSNTGIDGDITDINVPNLTSMWMDSTGITGSIGKVDFAGLVDGNSNEILPAHSAEDGFVKHCPAIVDFSAQNTQLEGDIDVFANCSKLNSLYLYNTNVEGDITSLSGITTLTYINVGYTKIHGDIGTGLSGCTNLSQIYVENCPLISGDLSKLNNNTRYISASATSGQFIWNTTRPSTAYVIAMNNVHLGEYLDAMLINQANCQPNKSTTSTMWNAITVRGVHSTDPTVRANANNAVRALMNKGYSVTINGVLQTEALLGQDAAASND